MRFLFLFLLSWYAGDTPPSPINYRIEKQSRVFINGSTNINSFQCFCNDEYQPLHAEYYPAQSLSAYSFQHTEIRIEASKIGCKNKLMNRDLHKALKADVFPFIKVDLIDVQQLYSVTPTNEQSWKAYQASVWLTIAGVRKKMAFPVQVRKLRTDQMRVLASKDLLMSEFGVKPRTPFNLIQIDDRIILNLDLVITWSASP